MHTYIVCIYVLFSIISTLVASYVLLPSPRQQQQPRRLHRWGFCSISNANWLLTRMSTTKTKETGVNGQREYEREREREKDGARVRGVNKEATAASCRRRGTGKCTWPGFLAGAMHWTRQQSVARFTNEAESEREREWAKAAFE